MKMSAEQRIAAPRQRVWEALNDPEILRASIPGCQSLDKESDTRFTSTVEVKVGPIGARFKGAVSLEDLNPPNGYTLILEGSGGIAGSVKGAAKVTLRDEGNETVLVYDVDAQIAGRMAQLGGPIIDATAKQLAGKFFRTFGDILTGAKPIKPARGAAPAASAAPSSAAASGAAVPAYAPAPMYAPAPAGNSLWAGVAIGLLLILVAFASFEYGRKTAAPVVVLDKALLHEIMHEHHHGMHRDATDVDEESGNKAGEAQ